MSLAGAAHEARERFVQPRRPVHRSSAGEQRVVGSGSRETAEVTIGRPQLADTVPRDELAAYLAHLLRLAGGTRLRRLARTRGLFAVFGGGSRASVPTAGWPLTESHMIITIQYDWNSRGAPMDTKVLTAHVPLSLAEKVDELAARLERSRGWIVKQALSAWIEQEEERHRLTLEALADVDAGHVIDHQAVQAWADSLGTRKPLPPPRR